MTVVLGQQRFFGAAAAGVDVIPGQQGFFRAAAAGVYVVHGQHGLTNQATLVCSYYHNKSL